MTFHDTAVFPTEVNPGTSAGPVFPNRIDEMPSGGSYRHALAESPTRRYSIKRRTLTASTFSRVQRFILARRGSLYGFRFLDVTEHTTAPDGVTEVDPDDTDHRHEIGTGNGVGKSFPLSTTRTDDAAYTSTRGITKPMRVTEAAAIDEPSYLKALTQTVHVYIDDVEQVESTDYSIDYSTGIVTFVTAPANGEVVSWAGYYFTPVRFGQNVDEWARVSRDSNPEHTFDDLEIVSDDEDDTIFALDAHPFGSSYHDCASLAQKSLEFSGGGIQRFDADSASADPFPIILPTARSWMLGGPLCTVVNVGSTATLRLYKADATTLVAAIAPGYAARIHLATDSAGDPEDWVVT